MTKTDAYRKLLPIQKAISVCNNKARKAYDEGRLSDMCTLLEENAKRIGEACTLAQIMVGSPLSN